MKITRISIYRKDLTYVGGQYAWGRGNVIEVGKSTIVRIETDSGLSGVGEFCPCGENYMDAHSEGTEAAARILSPALLGEDPRQLAHIERLMDNTIRGHGYAKSPFDAACWDILGKATGQPVWMLMGGKLFASDSPGLGVEADLDSLGDPVAIYASDARSNSALA